MAKVRVGVAGFGVIGQRLADGVALQEDMELVGVADEHLAVRNAAGLFDVSHMGLFEFTGENLHTFLHSLATNDISLLHAGDSQYSFLLAPDGQCCYRNTVTQERFCNCYRLSGGLRCVERDCKGPHESCEVTDISRDNMEQECNSGHFFFNQTTNRYGETDMEEARFEDSLLEVIQVAESLYRVRPAADVEVPVDF